MAQAEAPILAVCPTCGAMWRSGIVLAPGASLTAEGNVAGWCPQGHGRGVIPDGYYAVAKDAAAALLHVPAGQLQKIAETLSEARYAERDAPDIADRLDRVPGAEGLAQVFRALTSQRAAALYGLIAIILAIVFYLRDESDLPADPARCVENCIEIQINQGPPPGGPPGTPLPPPP